MTMTETQVLTLGGTMLLFLMLLAFLLRRSQLALSERLDRLEDALRVYNNANASVGRHVTSLERELGVLQKPRSEKSRDLQTIPTADVVIPTIGATLQRDVAQQSQLAERASPGPEAKLIRLLRKSA